MTPGLQHLLEEAGSAPTNWFAEAQDIEYLVMDMPLVEAEVGSGYYWRRVLEVFLEANGPHLKAIYFHKAAIERQVPHFRHDDDFTSAREALAALAEAITAGHADPEPFVEARRKRCLLNNPHGTQEVWRQECYDEAAIRAALPRELVRQWAEKYEAMSFADMLSE